MNKRVAIGIAAALVGLVLVTTLGILFAGGDRRLGAAKPSQSYAAAKYVLEIGGSHAGFLHGFSGCATSGDVVRAQPGTDQVVRKHVANVKYEPCVIELGAGSMEKPVSDWIKDMLARNPTRKNVTIIRADYNYKEKSRTTLVDAILGKVTFSALDASNAKDQARITLTLVPETMTKAVGSGATVTGQVGKQNKAWLTSNFRLSLNGINDLDFVDKISALEVTQLISEAEVGVSRIHAKEPERLEVGDLELSIRTDKSASLDAWFDDFVIKGNNAQSNEKSGMIQFLSPNMQDVLGQISLSGVGIFRAAETPQTVASEGAVKKLYSLYVEDVSFSVTPISGTAPGGGTTTTTTTTPQPATTTTAATTPVEATITPVSGELLVDGDMFTISDGVNEPTTFEFDFDGVVKGISIKIAKDAPAEEIASAIVEAVNAVGEQLEVVAQPAGEIIQLKSERGAEAGEEKVLEFVEADEFKVRDAVPSPRGEVLPAPAELKASTGSEGEINLAWSASEGALGYFILFTTERGGEYRELDKTDGTELTLAGLEPGVTHYFVIRATDGTRESANSPEASAPAG